MASQNYNDTQAAREAARCDDRVHRGTGEAFCDRPLNARGECDRAGDHIDPA